MENGSIEMKEHKFSFKKLSPEKKKELLHLQSKNNERTYVFLEKLANIYWFIVAASAIWITYLFYSSQNILWDEWVFWMNLAFTIVAVPALVLGLVKIFSVFVGRKKNGHIFSPNELIKIKGDLVQVWNLKQIESVRVVEDDKQLEVWSGTQEERINFYDEKSESDARQVERMFDTWKLNVKDEFLSGCDENKLAYNPTGKIAISVGLVAVSVLAAVGLSFAASAANVSYDDGVTWRMAEKIGTIDEVEKYKAKYPEGIYIEQANQKLGEKLIKIKDDYIANKKDSADAEAVETLSAVLDEISKNAERKIYVKAKESRELDQEMIGELKKITGFSVNSYEYSAPESNEDFRKQKILNDVKLMFRDIAKEGAIEFVLTDDPPENSPVVEVDYTIKSHKNIFRYDLYIDGKRSTSFNPALEFVFDFALRSGASQKEYKASYTTIPQTLKPVFFNAQDADNYSFDKKLFSTASEDFAVYLGGKFGFKEMTKEPEEENNMS